MSTRLLKVLIPQCFIGDMIPILGEHLFAARHAIVHTYYYDLDRLLEQGPTILSALPRSVRGIDVVRVKYYAADGVEITLNGETVLATLAHMLSHHPGRIFEATFRFTFHDGKRRTLTVGAESLTLRYTPDRYGNTITLWFHAHFDL